MGNSQSVALALSRAATLHQHPSRRSAGEQAAPQALCLKAKDDTYSKTGGHGRVVRLPKVLDWLSGQGTIDAGVAAMQPTDAAQTQEDLAPTESPAAIRDAERGADGRNGSKVVAPPAEVGWRLFQLRLLEEHRRSREQVARARGLYRRTLLPKLLFAWQTRVLLLKQFSTRQRRARLATLFTAWQSRVLLAKLLKAWRLAAHRQVGRRASRLEQAMVVLGLVVQNLGKRMDAESAAAGEALRQSVAALQGRLDEQAAQVAALRTKSSQKSHDLAAAQQAQLHAMASMARQLRAKDAEAAQLRMEAARRAQDLAAAQQAQQGAEAFMTQRLRAQGAELAKMHGEAAKREEQLQSTQKALRDAEKSMARELRCKETEIKVLKHRLDQALGQLSTAQEAQGQAEQAQRAAQVVIEQWEAAQRAAMAQQEAQAMQLREELREARTELAWVKKLDRTLQAGELQQSLGKVQEELRIEKAWKQGLQNRLNENLSYSTGLAKQVEQLKAEVAALQRAQAAQHLDHMDGIWGQWPGTPPQTPPLTEDELLRLRSRYSMGSSFGAQLGASCAPSMASQASMAPAASPAAAIVAVFGDRTPVPASAVEGLLPAAGSPQVMPVLQPIANSGASNGLDGRDSSSSAPVAGCAVVEESSTGVLDTLLASAPAAEEQDGSCAMSSFATSTGTGLSSISAAVSGASSASGCACRSITSSAACCTHPHSSGSSSGACCARPHSSGSSSGACCARPHSSGSSSGACCARPCSSASSGSSLPELTVTPQELEEALREQPPRPALLAGYEYSTDVVVRCEEPLDCGGMGQIVRIKAPDGDPVAYKFACDREVEEALSQALALITRDEDLHQQLMPQLQALPALQRRDQLQALPLVDKALSIMRANERALAGEHAALQALAGSVHVARLISGVVRPPSLGAKPAAPVRGRPAPLPMACGITMKLYGGGSVAKYLRAKVLPLALIQAVQWILQLLRALVDVHGKERIHADVKPDNMFIDAAGQAALVKLMTLHKGAEPEEQLPEALEAQPPIVLGDFGCCQQLKGGKATKVGGTPGYAAPEIFDLDADKSLPLDLWSAGQTAKCILLRTAPVWQQGMRHSVALQLPTSFPEDLRVLLDAMMADDPDERPTAPKAVEELERIMGELQQQPELALTPVSTLAALAPQQDAAQAGSQQDAAQAGSQQDDSLAAFSTA